MSTEAHLSAKHRAMLEVESGIAPEVIAERGYRTTRRRAELEQFPKWQRRLGLLVPMYSPDGETQLVQLRPNTPRKHGPKYETPQGANLIVDVHPSMRERVRHGDEPLWVTEGAKTGDANTSRGLPTVVLAGVWGWMVPKVRPYQLLPCWDYVRLKGRLVYVAFDSDVMDKPEVQQALQALVATLETRGAKVLVIYLPSAADGSKQGLDDFYAASGTPNEAKMLARKFEPQDLGQIRMSRDEKLRANVEELRASWWVEDWSRMVGTGEKPHWMRGHTARDVEHALIDHATRRGKVRDDGVAVAVSSRTLALDAKKGRPAVSKALKHMEAEGRLRIEEPEDRKKSRTYVLLTGRASSYHNGGKEALEGKATQELQTYDLRGNGLRAPTVPRLRWSAPGRKPRKVLIKQQPRKVWGVRRGVEAVKRLGPRLGRVLDYLEASGAADLEEIAEFLKCKRVRDVRRRVLDPLEAKGLIETTEGGAVSLVADWCEELEREREAKGEVAAEERDRARFREESRQYREHGPVPVAEDTPPLMGPERVSQIITTASERDEAARIEEQRRKVGTTAEVFIHDTLAALGKVRMGLLREVWEDKGGDPSHIWPAIGRIGCKLERLPEHDNALFVFPPKDIAKPLASPFTLRPEPEAELKTEAAPLPTDNCNSHPLDCECDECLIPEPKYARAYTGIAGAA